MTKTKKINPSKMKKVVINKCFGGYSVSPEAALWMYEKGWKELAIPIEDYFGLEKIENQNDHSPYSFKKIKEEWENYLKANNKKDTYYNVTPFTKDFKFVLNTRPEPRDHPILVKCIETLKKKANGSCAKLEIIEIPANVDFEINEYDGMESIHEKHRTWG